MDRGAISRLSATLMIMSAASLAYAESPMNVDDAGTLDKGGMKIEGVWQKDDEHLSGALLFGFSPIENLEIELGATRDNDLSANPAIKAHGFGVGVKWVPYQNEQGWSFGARFDYGQNLAEIGTEHVYELAGLASRRFGNGHILHMNVGRAHLRAQDEHVTVWTWGVGYELPMTQGLQLAAEIFGDEESRPDKALGLRYEVFDGFKVSAAIGQGNGRSFGQAGFAWEF